MIGGVREVFIAPARVWLSLCALLIAAGIGKQDADPPSADPDRVVLTWAADPATTLSVTWRTDTTVSEPVAEIAPSAPGPRFEDSAETYRARTVRLEVEGAASHHHTVTFGGLVPNGPYLYRVAGGGEWSEWHAARTAADQPEPFTFLFLGDAQEGVRSHWSRVIRAAYAAAPDARFALHAGDLVDDGGTERTWGDWFRAGSWIHSTVPVVPVTGNNEFVNDPDDSDGVALTPHWSPHFAFPDNGPPGMENAVYYLDVQGVRIVALDTERPSTFRQQAEWLNEVLAENPNRWTVVSFHRPLFPCGVGITRSCATSGSRFSSVTGWTSFCRRTTIFTPAATLSDRTAPST